MASPRSEHATERKLGIIKATIECIARIGYCNFSMQDVAQVANVSKGIIHYYFLNKDELLLAVLDYVHEEIESLLHQPLKAASPPPKERLVEAIRLCASVVQSHKDYFCIHMNFWSHAAHDAQIKIQLAAHYERLRNYIAQLIQIGIEQKLFRPGQGTHYASLVLALLEGLALQWLFDEKAFSYNEMVEHCETAILNFLELI